MNMRGVLTDEIREVSKARLGYVISKDELSLMPYVQNVVMNSKRLDESNLNNVKLGVIEEWHDKGFLCFAGYDVHNEQLIIEVDMSFWDAMGEILWLSYVKPPAMLGNVN